MITLEQFLTLTKYNITDSSEYMWKCYGDKARFLDCGFGGLEKWTASIIFDTVTKVVYQVEVCDTENERAYRMLNKVYADAYFAEAAERGVNADQSWDDVDFVDLEEDEDFSRKLAAIVAGEEYDTRVTLSLDLDDTELFELMKQAHEKDVTLNQYFEHLLRGFIESKGEIDAQDDI